MSTDEVLYRCWSKATCREKGLPRRSENWAFSRRAWFNVLRDRITCGDWTIPFDQVTEAIAYRTSSMFIPVTILELRTEENSYQFGFNPWAHPLQHLDLDYREEHVKLGTSPLSLLIRLAAIGLLVYAVVRKLLSP